VWAMYTRTCVGITDDVRENFPAIFQSAGGERTRMQIIVNNLCINGLCAGTCFFVLINLLLMLIPRGREKRPSINLHYN